MSGIKGKGGVKGRSGGARPGAGRKKSNVAGQKSAANQQMDRQMVSIAAAAGIHYTDIAEGLGISVPTLLERFATELSAGAHRHRMEILCAMFAAAKKGSVSAQRAFLALTPTPKPAAREPAPGKKAQAEAASKTAAAGTSWEDLLKPPTRLQ